MVDLHTLDKYRLKDVERWYSGAAGDSENGMFKVFVGRHSFLCIASDSGGWEHVSVSPWSEKRKVCPTWEEMCEIKRLFWGDDEAVMQLHPPKADYINLYPYCLHLWKPTEKEIPCPPNIMV